MLKILESMLHILLKNLDTQQNCSCSFIQINREKKNKDMQWCINDKKITIKVHKYTGGKFSKDRVLVRRNANGMEKIMFFVIRKLWKLHCFKRMNTLFCEYAKQKHTWMNEWSFHLINAQLQSKNAGEMWEGNVICNAQPTQRTLWIL